MRGPAGPQGPPDPPGPSALADITKEEMLALLKNNNEAFEIGAEIGAEVRAEVDVG